MNLFIIAQFLGILVIILNVIAMQLKEKKNIIFIFFLINVFATINYYLLESNSGAIICFFAIIQLFVNNLFEKKGKSIPKIIITVYIIISIFLGSLTFNGIIDIIPIICSILFTLSIIQSKEKNIRLITLFNVLFWVFYGIYSRAYTAALSDLITTISTLIGIYRLDIKGKAKDKDITNNK